jgi:hypothetical protein
MASEIMTVEIGSELFGGPIPAPRFWSGLPRFRRDVIHSPHI